MEQLLRPKPHCASLKPHHGWMRAVHEEGQHCGRLTTAGRVGTRHTWYTETRARGTSPAPSARTTRQRWPPLALQPPPRLPSNKQSKVPCVIRKFPCYTEIPGDVPCFKHVRFIFITSHITLPRSLVTTISFLRHTQPLTR